MFWRSFFLSTLIGIRLGMLLSIPVMIVSLSMPESPGNKRTLAMIMFLPTLLVLWLSQRAVRSITSKQKGGERAERSKV